MSPTSYQTAPSRDKFSHTPLLNAKNQKSSFFFHLKKTTSSQLNKDKNSLRIQASIKVFVQIVNFCKYINKKAKVLKKNADIIITKDRT